MISMRFRDECCAITALVLCFYGKLRTQKRLLAHLSDMGQRLNEAGVALEAIACIRWSTRGALLEIATHDAHMNTRNRIKLTTMQGAEWDVLLQH
eukprot:6191436-Pleurochrysis_carterae.AAC.4